MSPNNFASTSNTSNPNYTSPTQPLTTITSNQNHYVKLEFPKFDGNDVTDWIFKVEQFFELDQTPENSKLRMAGIHFEGKAMSWFKAYERICGRIMLWKEFVATIAA